MTISINQEKFTFKPWKQLIYIPDTNSEFDGKVVPNPHLSGGGRSFPKYFMSRCKTFSFLAWLAVKITAIARTHTSSLTVFYGSILSNPESQNKHHSIHPAYLSGIMWGSRKKKKRKQMETLWWRRRRKHSSERLLLLFTPTTPSAASPAHSTHAPSGQGTSPFQTLDSQPRFLDSAIFSFPMGRAAVLTSQEQLKDHLGSQDLLTRSGGPLCILRSLGSLGEGKTPRLQHLSDIWIPWSQ